MSEKEINKQVDEYIKVYDIEEQLREKDKEIERLREENLLLRASEPMSKLQEDYGYKAEVERLNNIINCLEQYIKYYVMNNFKFDNNTADIILYQLEKLKDSDKE